MDATFTFIFHIYISENINVYEKKLSTYLKLNKQMCNNLLLKLFGQLQK